MALERADVGTGDDVHEAGAELGVGGLQLGGSLILSAPSNSIKQLGFSP